MDKNKKQQKAEANKKYYAKHKTEIAKKKKNYYQANRDKYSKRMKAYYIENKTELAKKHKEYYEKHKYQPSKKHSNLINITVSIPSMEEILTPYTRCPEDYRSKTEAYLIEAIEQLSKGTKYEDICKELIEKASSVLKFYEEGE